VLKERANVAATPNDGEAWGRLAKDYKALFFLNKAYRTDQGGEELYQSSVAAYEKCLALLPKDAQWHAGFADLLTSRAYWDFSATSGTADLYRGLQEIRTALQLAPNDAKVQEIAQEISGMFPDGMSQNGKGYDFLWLTETPTPLPHVPGTPTPESAQTPSSGQPPTSAPSSKPASPVCGTAALAPLAIVLWVVRKRRHND
jgi:hypothetical protein